MIFTAALLPWEAGAAGAGGATVPAGAPGWLAPHLLQNLAPSASGFPQLTQNVAIDIPPLGAQCYHGLMWSFQPACLWAKTRNQKPEAALSAKLSLLYG